MLKWWPDELTRDRCRRSRCASGSCPSGAKSQAPSCFFSSVVVGSDTLRTLARRQLTIFSDQTDLCVWCNSLRTDYPRPYFKDSLCLGLSCVMPNQSCCYLSDRWWAYLTLRTTKRILCFTSSLLWQTIFAQAFVPKAFVNLKDSVAFAVIYCC